VAVTVPPSPAAPLAISLFGPWEVCRLGEPLPRLHSRKGQWLLALLTLRHGRVVDRAWNGSVVGPGPRHSWEAAVESAECRALPLRPGRRQQDERVRPIVNSDGEGDLALRVESARDP
jgi:hypothetical protein